MSEQQVVVETDVQAEADIRAMAETHGAETYYVSSQHTFIRGHRLAGKLFSIGIDVGGEWYSVCAPTWDAAFREVAERIANGQPTPPAPKPVCPQCGGPLEKADEDCKGHCTPCEQRGV